MLLFYSCLEEEPGNGCPDQYQITLNVKDKNYDNIRDIPELNAVDENLPFKAYVSEFSYQLKSLATGQVVAAQSYQPVTSAEKFLTLSFEGLPAGAYQLVTSGNLPGMEDSGEALISLHPEGEESSDIYLSSDTLLFSDTPASKEVYMKRTKGNLVVICKNFPAETDKILLRTNSVSLNINKNLEYTRSTSVTKTFPGQTPILQTWLAPSVSEKLSSMTLLLFSPQNREPYLIMPDIKFKIERNKITELMVDFNEAANIIEISIRIDGRWSIIHQLILN